MTEYLFPPPATVSAPIRGSVAAFPIRRIFCVGRNYEAHAREMGIAVDRETPFYFIKAAYDYVPSGATIPYPPGTENFHYEMEMVVAIGQAGFRIAEADATSHIFGYACGLDMTRRDVQQALRQRQHPWDLGKDFENAAVLSEIVPAAQIGHPLDAGISLAVNGVVRQSSNINMLIHSIPALLAHLSRYYHLQPGDLIYTGTPEGVGPVVAGDALHGEIEGIGSISLHIGAAE